MTIANTNYDDPKTNQIHTAHTTLPVPLILDCVTSNYKLINKGKLAISKKVKEIDEDNPKTQNTVTNNALFVGSTAELQKMIQGK